jgi:cell division protease FtsH
MATGERPYSEDTAREIDCAVRQIVQTAFDRAVAILTGARDVLERGARQLLEHETLQERDLQALRVALPPPPAVPAASGCDA